MKKKKLSEQQKANMLKAKSQANPKIDECMPGLVISHLNKFINCLVEGDRVVTVANNKTFELVVGDHVTLGLKNNQYVLVERQERFNSLRRTSNDQHHKVMAANVDLALVVLAPTPEPYKEIIAQYKTYLEVLKIPYCFILNKIELCHDDHWLNQLLSYFKSIGDSVLKISCLEHQGLDDLKKILQSKTSVLIGPSGVGKSSIVNFITSQTKVKIGTLSASDRGEHTTSVGELFVLEDGSKLIDSPGIRQFNLDVLSAEDLQLGFPEFQEFPCKFRDCLHMQTLGCQVNKAIEQGAIPQFRFDEYLFLFKKFVIKK